MCQTASTSGAPSDGLCFDPVALAPDGPALRTPISLDARRMPLSEFAQRLGSAARTSVSLPPELATRPITAHLEKQPMGDTMRALSRLYGLEWQKVAGGYRAKVTASGMEQRVLRAGDIGEWQARTSTRQELQTIATHVLTQVPRAALEGGEGVPLSQVLGLSEQLRRNRQMDFALSLIQNWSATSPWLSRAKEVHLIQPPSPLNTPAPSRLVVTDSSGQVVADLGVRYPPVPHKAP